MNKNQTLLSVAENAAGITIAFYESSLGDENGSQRWCDLNKRFEGQVGILNKIAQSAIILEDIILELNDDTLIIYDLWDMVGDCLWNQIDIDSIEDIVHGAVDRVIENYKTEINNE